MGSARVWYYYKKESRGLEEIVNPERLGLNTLGFKSLVSIITATMVPVYTRCGSQNHIELKGNTSKSYDNGKEHKRILQHLDIHSF